MKPLSVGSLFTGIGGFDLGFQRAGMQIEWQAENDEDCNLVLGRHWPDVRRFQDVREWREAGFEPTFLRPVSLIAGGFPCQDLSVAGRRQGLVGVRSGLWFEFHRILRELGPRWVVIENVTGLLSSNAGRDFAALLGGLAHGIPRVPDHGWGKAGFIRGSWYCAAWRVLDAQYWGVAQRRRKVFIVASLGDGRCAQVLFEPESGPGNPPTSERAGQESPTIAETGPHGVGVQAVGFSKASHPLGIEGLAEPITRRNWDPGCVAYSVHPKTGDRRWVSDTYVVAHALGGKAGYRLGTEEDYVVSLAENQRGEIVTSDVTPALSQPGGKMGQGYPVVQQGMAVRRLIPLECERLQGFPDGWTEGQSDSARYSQLGNAVAVPVATWIGQRIIAAN